MSEVLKIVGPHPNEGVQDDEGTEYFNDEVWSTFGRLGKLKTHQDGADLVIDQADPVILLKRGYGADGSVPGVEVKKSPFGIDIFEVNARNGVVRYQLHADEVEFEDGQKLTSQLAVIGFHQWVAEGPPPPRTKNAVTVTKVGE